MKMAGETEDTTPRSETEQLIWQELTWQRIEMYEPFNQILSWITNSICLTSIRNPMRIDFDKVIPFKVQMKLDIPNLEGNIEEEYVDN